MPKTRLLVGIPAVLGLCALCLFVRWAVLAHWASSLRFPSLHPGPPTESITWDFRKGPHKIAEVNWPASERGNLFERKGQFDLTIIGPKGDVIFHQQVQNFICERKGDELENTYVHFATASTGEQAYEILKKVMTDWQFPANAFVDLETWHDGIVRRVSYPDFVRQHEKDRDFFPGLYPGFEAGKAGNVGMRASEVGGHAPETGDLEYILSLSF